MDLDLAGALEEDLEEALVQTVVLDREHWVAAVVLDRVVQVAAALEATWAQVLQEVEAEMEAPVAVMV